MVKLDKYDMILPEIDHELSQTAYQASNVQYSDGLVDVSITERLDHHAPCRQLSGQLLQVAADYQPQGRETPQPP